MDLDALAPRHQAAGIGAAGAADPDGTELPQWWALRSLSRSVSAWLPCLRKLLLGWFLLVVQAGRLAEDERHRR